MHFYFYTIHLLIYGESFPFEREIIIVFVKIYYEYITITFSYFFNSVRSENELLFKYDNNVFIICENVVHFLIKFELIASPKISFTFLRVILYVQLNLY